MSEEIYFKNTFLSQKNKLYRFAFFFLKKMDEAKDATQETLIKIWDKREEWPKIENPDAWSMQIIKNNCLDRLRKTKRDQKHLATLKIVKSTDQNPGSISIWKDQWMVMQQVMEQLSEKRKAVFVLREIEGNSYHEIAESLNISEKQVKSDLYRSRKYLKDTMLKINNHGIGTTQTRA